MKYTKKILVLLVLSILITGCGSPNNVTTQFDEDVTVDMEVADDEIELDETIEDEVEEEVEDLEEEIEEDEEVEISYADQIGYVANFSSSYNNNIIVIDAGHQSSANSNLEPNGPGSTTMKKKVSSGTQGRFTGVAEYVLNLVIAKQLQSELEARGYQVIMIRTTHNVDISNAERAVIANSYNAGAFIRIHANGSENAATEGMMTICPTASNPYCGPIYSKSRSLSDYVLNGMLDTTGAQSQGVWETDTMTGTNWSTVPTTIVEMGYMTNEKEDWLMQDSDYQTQIVQGIANGIDNYMKTQ